MFKKFIKSLALFTIICALAIIIPTKNPSSAYADGVSEIAMEMLSGKILHDKNSSAHLPMASTTKIMTALIVCEECNLDEVIIVPDEAVGVEGSSIYLKKGEEISVCDLLYGLMLRSGNDAATALAIHHSGSVEKFVERMNAKANELKASDTHFTNPSGLPDESHYTTAKDLCNIARIAMQNDTFAEVVSTTSYTGTHRSFTNKNKLLKSLDGANGIKTGYTEKAGRCLVSSAKRDDMDIICVVLNCYDMFERSAEIINDGFDNNSVKVISKEKVFHYKGEYYSPTEDIRLVIKNGTDLTYFVKQVNNETGSVKLQIFDQNNLISDSDLYKIK